MLLLASTPEWLTALERAESGGGAWGSFLLGMAITLTGIGLLVFAALCWRAADARRRGPELRALARRHGLSREELALMRRAADCAHLPDAGPMFLSPGCFTQAKAAYVQQIGASPRLDRIEQSLFPGVRTLEAQPEQPANFAPV